MAYEQGYDALPAGCALHYTLHGSPDSMLLLLLVLGAHYGCCAAVWDTPLTYSSYTPSPPPSTSEQCASTVSPSSYQPHAYHHYYYDPLSALFHMAELLTVDPSPEPAVLTYVPDTSSATHTPKCDSATHTPKCDSATHTPKWDTPASDDTPIIGIFLYCLVCFTILWMPSLYIPYPAQRYKLHAVNQVYGTCLCAMVCCLAIRRVSPFPQVAHCCAMHTGAQLLYQFATSYRGKKHSAVVYPVFVEHGLYVCIALGCFVLSHCNNTSLSHYAVHQLCTLHLAGCVAAHVVVLSVCRVSAALVSAAQSD